MHPENNTPCKMKTRLFERLKQEYSPLGLSDTLLLNLARNLANSGHVTNENLEDVVMAQKECMEIAYKEIKAQVPGTTVRADPVSDTTSRF